MCHNWVKNLTLGQNSPKIDHIFYVRPLNRYHAGHSKEISSELTYYIVSSFQGTGHMYVHKIYSWAHKYSIQKSTKSHTWPRKLLHKNLNKLQNKSVETVQKMCTQTKLEQKFASFTELIDRINLKYEDCKSTIGGGPSNISNGEESTYIEKLVDLASNVYNVQKFLRYLENTVVRTLCQNLL